MLNSLDENSFNFSLTSAEHCAVILASEGLSTKEISGRMNVSYGTARNFLYWAYRKMGVKNRAGAASLLARLTKRAPDLGQAARLKA